MRDNGVDHARTLLGGDDGGEKGHEEEKELGSLHGQRKGVS